MNHMNLSKTHLNFKEISTMNEEEMQSELTDVQDKIERASQQISHLDAQIAYLKKLFRRAVKNDGYAVRYNLRMQLSISSGVKVMYHHYAATMQGRANELMRQIRSSSSPSSLSSVTSDESTDGGSEPVRIVVPVRIVPVLDLSKS